MVYGHITKSIARATYLRKRLVFLLGSLFFLFGLPWPVLFCVCMFVGFWPSIDPADTSTPTGMFWFQPSLLKSLCSSSVLVLATTWSFQFVGNFHSSLLQFSSIGPVGWRVKKLFCVIKCYRGEMYLVAGAELDGKFARQLQFLGV